MPREQGHERVATSVRQPVAVVVLGVAGVGKTTVARRLAERMEAEFADADEYHDHPQIAKMSAGIPLEDEDRWDWLRRLRTMMDDALQRGRPVVLACSALKAAYRDVLRRDGASTTFVALDLSRTELERRIAARTDHFMPASMLDSQLAALEPLTFTEREKGAFSVSADAGVDEIVDEIMVRMLAEAR